MKTGGSQFNTIGARSDLSADNRNSPTGYSGPTSHHVQGKRAGSQQWRVVSSSGGGGGSNSTKANSQTKGQIKFISEKNRESVNSGLSNGGPKKINGKRDDSDYNFNVTTNAGGFQRMGPVGNRHLQNSA